MFIPSVYYKISIVIVITTYPNDCLMKQNDKHNKYSFHNALNVAICAICKAKYVYMHLVNRDLYTNIHFNSAIVQ